MRYGNEFLRGRWEERVRSEHAERSPQEERREQDVESYLDIKESVRNAEEGGERLAQILGDVERRAVRYRMTVNTWERERRTIKGDVIGATEETERNRRLAHEVLIDGVNLLSRQFKEYGLDNEWRRNMGIEREDAGRWGLNIAQLIYRKFEEEHHDD